jgi:hypothetical protein
MEKAKALLQCVPWMLPEDGFSNMKVSDGSKSCQTMLF